MDAVLAGVLGMPLHLAVEIRYRKGVRELHATVALDPGDDVVGCRVEVRPAAMALELELLACVATVVMTAFAAALPLSRVEAATIQRTITPY